MLISAPPYAQECADRRPPGRRDSGSAEVEVVGQGPVELEVGDGVGGVESRRLIEETGEEVGLRWSALARGIGTGWRRRRTRGGIPPLDAVLRLPGDPARQPPWGVISVASATARGSQANPFTTPPSSSSTLPIASGGGTSATKAPSPRSHTSTSIAAPAPSAWASPGVG